MWDLSSFKTLKLVFKIVVRGFTVPTLPALYISFGIQSVPDLQFLDLYMTASTSSVVISPFVFAAIDLVTGSLPSVNTRVPLTSSIRKSKRE